MSRFFEKIKHIDKKNLAIVIGIYLLGYIMLRFSLPSILFNDPYSTVVLDRNDKLLGVKISSDGQWRFPETEFVPEKIKQCFLVYEDKRFYYHFGVDPIATIRALKQNISQGKVVSGGSTITMQVIRLSRKNKPRTIFEKIIESYLAISLECNYSKDEILKMYISHAPFGGNVVGIEAAAWRYFGRPADQLTWAESAMLAVLPNSPSITNTAKNREQLKAKRDKLLKKLYEKKIISSQDLGLALEEPLTTHPNPYPLNAYHFVCRAEKENKGRNVFVKTSLDYDLQIRVNEIIDNFSKKYSLQGINNIACLIVEVETGDVITYVGNVNFNSDIPERLNDMVVANRSTGSLLKPILYAAALSDGQILPKSFLKDVPTKIAGFSPENFDRDYSGAVPADIALARSLNIPFVHLLKEFGISKFLFILRSIGFDKINKSSDFYGLSLILGGAESSLEEICAVYSSMARSLKYFNENSAKYYTGAYHKLNYLKDKSKKEGILKETSLLSAGSIWYSFEAMTSLNRPGHEKQWYRFSSKQKIAWKTGTSFGFRDAWAVAVRPDYVIGVWVGNSNNVSNSQLIGLNIAAPILFEINSVLPAYDKWFDFPYDDMNKLPVCKTTGFLASSNCPNIDSVYVPKNCENAPQCPYHKSFSVDFTERYRVYADCHPAEQIKIKSFLVLPPVMEAYYKIKNPDYEPLPPLLEDCMETVDSKTVMELIYPVQLSRVYMPIDFKGDTIPVVFKAVHKNSDAEIYWYINEKYRGSTKEFHEKTFKLEKGDYLLTLVDDKGNSITKKFNVISKK